MDAPDVISIGCGEMTWLRSARDAAERALYRLGGRRPWTRGYYSSRQMEIAKVIDEKLFDAGNLPQGYGFRMDDRVIEYPWLLSVLPAGDGLLLDAGSALNDELLLSREPLCSKKVFISTLAPEVTCHWRMGISYIFEDLRESCFRDGYFDFVASISTVEHIGMDNLALYTDDESKKESDPSAHLLAIREFRRVLKRGGRLFVSVPFGKRADHGWFQVFDAAMVDAMIGAFSPTVSREFLFAYKKDGWHCSDRTESRDATYFDIHEKKAYDEDYAAASRAVICLDMVK